MANFLKSEEEVREFIENIGIEYKFSCLSEKEPEGCFLLGQWYEQEKANFKGAADSYRKGCDELNYSKCCDRLAFFQYFGKSMEKNYSKAKDYWLKGCYDAKGATPRDITLSCYHGGQMLIGAMDGADQIKTDPAKGLEMLEKACKLNLPEACQVLHETYLFGNDLVQKDTQKAVDYGIIGCNSLNYVCCHNTYKILAKGDGIAKDLVKANELKEKLKEVKYQMTHEMHFSQYT